MPGDKPKGDHFCVNRSLFEHDIWRNGKPYHPGMAWLELVGFARWRAGTAFIRGVAVPLERGQLCWSRAKLAARWRWSPGRVDRFLEWLDSEDQIGQQKNNVTTVITIVNYNEYQGNGVTGGATDGLQTGKQTVAQTGKQTDTKEEREQGKQENNEKKTTPKPPEGAEGVPQKRCDDCGQVGPDGLACSHCGRQTTATDVPAPPASGTKTGNGQPRKSKTFTPDRITELDFPPKLDNDTAREALAVWLQEKIDRGQAYKSTRGPNGILKAFETIGTEGMESAIAHSIANNYAGVFTKNSKSPAIRAGPDPKPTHCQGTCKRELATVPGLVLDGLCPDCYAAKWD